MSSPLTAILGASLLVTALAVTPLAAASAGPLSSPADPVYPYHFLQDVDAVSSSDVWAVGGDQQADGGTESYAEHFDGSRWRHVRTPPDVADFLQGVSAASSSDVWAVGTFDDGRVNPYALHWDGIAWSKVLTADPGQPYSLDAVDALASDDVWAVGGVAAGSGAKALVEHWDGSAWSVVDTPVVDDAVSTSLSGVEAIGADDVWAVGPSYGAVGSQDPAATIMHWDGAQWSIVPSHAGTHVTLTAVSATAGDDVWAVGSRGVGHGDSVTVTEHWDGSRWGVVDSPNGSGPVSTLSGVEAVAPDDAWAVGATRLAHLKGGPSRQSEVPLFEHWDGATWSIVDRLSKDRYSYLAAVSAVSSSDIWSVGGRRTSTSYQDLKLHWNGQRWR